MRRKKIGTAVISLAMMTMLLFTGCGNTESTGGAAEPAENAGVITLSVNPQIQIGYDREGKVTELIGVNQDGEKVVAAYPDYIGKECDDVLEDLIEEIYEEGFFEGKIDGNARPIVIQLEPGSSIPYDGFLTELKDECDYTADNLKLTSDVFLIDDDDYDESYTTEKQRSHYITLAKAKQIALSQANVKAADAVFKEREFDFDDGKAVYELEFRAGGVKYEYDIDALTGRILEAERSKIKTQTVKKPQTSGSSGSSGGSAGYGNTDYGNTNYGNTNYGSGTGSSTGGSNTNYSNYGGNTNYDNGGNSNYGGNTNYDDGGNSNYGGNTNYDDGGSNYDDGDSGYDD